MSKSQTLRIPPEAKRVLDAAAELLNRRKADERIDAEKVTLDRAATADAERAGQSLERIEIDLAVADVDGNEADHRQLTAERSAAFEAAEKRGKPWRRLSGRVVVSPIAGPRLRMRSQRSSME